MKISLDIIPEIYKISKQVNDNIIRSSEGAKLISDLGVKESSASDYIYGLKAMLKGERFTRTLNTASMEFFMENIFKDYGTQGLRNALFALKLHIEYYESVNKTNTTMHSMRRILAYYTLMLPKDILDDIEQAEILTYIKKEKSREDILNELRNLKETDPEIVIINHKSYKRDNRTIALIKDIRGYKCQICEKGILKSDGSYYVEAAHIYPKHKTGRETPDNILLLCPNHHKEFDLGNRENVSKTINGVKFDLNGVSYVIDLSIE